MNVVADFLALLRPRRSGVPASPAGEAAPAPKPPASATELVDALQRLRSERAAAEHSVLQAARRRDELLLDPGSDAAIHQLDSEVDAAHLLIERLNRLEPELQRELEEQRAGDRCVRGVPPAVVETPG